MQLFEHDCPACNCRLRMRGPLRDRQEFDCPDCSIALLVQLNGGSCEVLIDDRAAPKPANKGASSAPKIVAWSTAGVLIAGFIGFLLTGSDATTGPQPEADDQQKTAIVEVAQPPVDPKPASLPDLEIEQQEPTQPVDSPPPPEPVVAKSNPVETEVVPPIPEPVEVPPDPAELERQRIVEQERVAIAAINRKLALELIQYRTADGLNLLRLLDELSAMSGVPVVANGVEKELARPVSIELNSCTLQDILKQALADTGLSYEVRANAIVILNEQ